MGHECKVKSKNLYDDYKKWCEENREKELFHKRFTARLLERGDITKMRNRRERDVRGIGLMCGDAPDF